MNNEAQAGWDAMQAEARKAAAYNALRKQYGDVAGDPTATLQMQKYGFDQQNDPLVLQGNALANTGAQQKIDFDKQDDPLKIQSDQDKVDNDPVVLAGNKLDLAAKQAAARSQHAQMLHGVFSGTLDGLEQEGAGMIDPAQRAALFDRHASAISGMAGMDDPATQAELAKEKARFVEGGTDAIPGMRSDLDAATQAQMTPKEVNDQKMAQFQLDKAKSDAASSASKAQTAATKAAGTAPGAGMSDKALDQRVLNWTKVNGKPEAIRGQIDAINGVDTKLVTMLGHGVVGGQDGDPNRWKRLGNDGLIQQSLGMLSKLQGMSSWDRYVDKHDKNSIAAKLQANLDQIADSTALADLQNLKAGGTSLGRVTNAEFTTLSRAIINANADADYKTLKQGLKNAGDFFMKLHNAATNTITVRNGDLAGWHRLVKGTPYGNPNDPDEADTPAAAPGVLTAPAGATGVPTPAGGGATPAPAAAPDPNNPATVTPLQLQQQGVLTPDAPNVDAAQAAAVAAGLTPAQVQQGNKDATIPTAGQPADATPAATPISLPAGQRLIPNFAAANDTAALEQATADPTTRRTLPAGMRNNNPGNIKFVGQRGTTPSANTDEGDPQAVYPTAQAGMNAMSTLLQKKFNGGKVTPDQMIAGNGGWTPGNHDAAANVAKTMGITADTQMNFNDPVQKAKFMRALILQEHGPKSRLYPDSMILAAAGAQPGAAPDTRNSVPGDGPAPAADQQTVAANAPAGPQAPAGMQQTSQLDPRAGPAPTAKAKPGDSGAGQLQGMTPMQVATQPVALPSALDVGLPSRTGNAFADARQKPANVLGDVNDILARYGLRKRTV